MTLYEINQGILDCVDAETGEIIDVEKLDALQLARDEKIGNIAAYIKNLSAESKAIKAEEDALAARRKSADKKIKDLKDYLAAALNGQKFKDARCSVYFSRSAPAVRFANDDERGFVEWAKENAPEYLVYAEPTVNKTKLKDDINSGLEFSKATLEASTYIVIK